MLKLCCLLADLVRLGVEKKKKSCCNPNAAKIVCLFLFGIVMPVLCVILPVYARYVLYADSIVTFAASDMRNSIVVLGLNGFG